MNYNEKKVFETCFRISLLSTYYQMFGKKLLYAHLLAYYLSYQIVILSLNRLYWVRAIFSKAMEYLNFSTLSYGKSFISYVTKRNLKRLDISNCSSSKLSEGVIDLKHQTYELNLNKQPWIRLVRMKYNLQLLVHIVV